MTLRLPRSYNQPVQQAQFADRLLERLKSTPGVEAVAVSSVFPLTGVTDVGIRFEAGPADLSTTTANYYRATPGYFRVMQIPMIRGRLIAEQDTPLSPPVVVINETMAPRFFPDEDPVGKRLDVTAVTYMR